MTDEFSQTADGLIRSCDRAALGTVMPSAAGIGAWPYVSLVLVAVDHDLSPILLLSDLAEHSRAIADHPRVSLLFDGTADLVQPLTGPRVSLLGKIAETHDERLKRRFLARHPDAVMYAGFKDFRFYRVTPERAHLVAGFGKIAWIEASEMPAVPPLTGLIEGEESIVRHMNEDHRQAIQLYAGKLLGLPGSNWTMTGIDAAGIDLRQAGQVARLAFPSPLASADEARGALISLLRAVRDN